MITDAQIAELTPDERRDLIKRLAAPVHEVDPTPRWFRHTRELRLFVMVASAVLLVPWIAYLGVSLPRVYAANHWKATWVGFDVLLFVMIAATAVLGYLRRQLVMLTAFAAGVLLLADAWFDVLTANPRDVQLSLATAILVEVPLGLMMILTSLQLLRLVAARLWSVESHAHSWQVRIPLPSAADRAVSRRRARA